MADSQNSSYSALPVFSGEPLSRPPGELTAPRLSGIPMLVAPKRVPKSQSMRDLRLNRDRPAEPRQSRPELGSGVAAGTLRKPQPRMRASSSTINLKQPKETTPPKAGAGRPRIQSTPTKAPATSRAFSATQSTQLKTANVKPQRLSRSPLKPQTSQRSAESIEPAKSLRVRRVQPQKTPQPAVSGQTEAKKQASPHKSDFRSIFRRKQGPQPTPINNGPVPASPAQSHDARARKTQSAKVDSRLPQSQSMTFRTRNAVKRSPRLPQSSSHANLNQKAQPEPNIALHGIHTYGGHAGPSHQLSQSANHGHPGALVQHTHSGPGPSALPYPPSEHSHTSRIAKDSPSISQLSSRLSSISSIPQSQSMNFKTSAIPVAPSRHRPQPLDLRCVRGMIPSEPPTASSAADSRSSSQKRSLSETTRKLFSTLRRSATSSRTSGRSAQSSTRENSRPASPSLYDDEWETVDSGKDPIPQVQEALSVLIPESLAGISVEKDPESINPPLPGIQVAKTPGLTSSERIEILDYRHVYYTGQASAKLQTPNYTDEQGNYKHALHDHIAFRYEIMSELGKGSFGKVFKCRDHKTGRLVAVKVTCNRREMRHQARVEANLLMDLAKQGIPERHHFLRYLANFSFRNHLCICTEILGDNLYELLRRNKFKGFPLDLVRYFTRQLVEGLEFLDMKGIIHCDLKPENILVSNVERCQVKIIDFGSSCHETKRVYTYIQSRFYRAPEILLGVPYSTAIDMWSLGCIIPELIMGKPLFPGEDETDQVACLCQVLGSPSVQVLKASSRSNVFFDMRGNPLTRRSPEGIVRGLPGSKSLDTFLPPLAADFVGQLLQWSPHKRLSAGGALFHEFVMGI